MKYWLLKTEPGAFSIDDLLKKGTAPWDGVRNYQARNFMRDSMKVGDRVFIYHSGEKPGIAGEGEVVSKSYPDPTQFDAKSRYNDPKATEDKPRWFLVDIKFVAKYPHPVLLSRLRNMRELESMVLLKPGMRLSVQPVSLDEYKTIVKNRDMRAK